MSFSGVTPGQDSSCAGDLGPETPASLRNAPQEFSCLSCGCDKASVFLSDCRDYYMGKPGRFDYYMCASCKLVQLHPVPLEMSRFYESYDMHSTKSLPHRIFRRLL